MPDIGRGKLETLVTPSEFFQVQPPTHPQVACWEERTSPMVFIAASCNGTSAVVDGQDNHAGEHLACTRSGATLLIVGDFLHHGRPQREEWHMSAAKKE